MRVYGIDNPDTTFVWVKSGDFNNTHYKTAYDFGWSKRGQAMPYFWSLASYSGIDNASTLDLAAYDAETLDLVVLGNFISRHPVVSIEALTISGQSTYLLDISVEPYSDRIWAVDHDSLYCYDALVPYTDNSKLIKKQYDAAAHIEVSSEYVLRNENIEIEYIWVRPTIGLIKHRVWIEYPDGTQYTILDGVLTTYTVGSDSWIWGEPIKRSLRARDELSFSEYGDYVISLEALYSDGTTSIDQRVISVVYKTPLGQWSISSLGIYRPVVGIDIDYEGRFWVLNDEGGRHEILFHYDKMLIDFKDKVIYLRDQYDQVRVF
jgi:hypothetical protein